MQVIYLFIQYKQINLFIQTVHAEHLFSPVFNELVVEHNKTLHLSSSKTLHKRMHLLWSVSQYGLSGMLHSEAELKDGVGKLCTVQNVYTA